MEVEEKVVEISGKNIFCRCIVGDSGRTVLMLHGMRFSSREWAEIDAIRKIHQWGFNVIAVDYPGFGKSEQIPEFSLENEDYSPASKFVMRFCQEMGLSSVTIIGPSMGGAITLKTLIDFPDLVDEIIAIAPAGFEEMKGDLYRIDKPVHLVWGSADDTIDISYGRRYHDLIAGSTLTVIKGADHVPYLKKTSQFFSLMKKFLLDE